MEPVRALTNTSLSLLSARNGKDLLSQLTRCSCYETDSSFSAVYMNQGGRFILENQSHSGNLPRELSNEAGLIDFILDCRDYLVYHGDGGSFLSSLCLFQSIKSAAAFPLCQGTNVLGILILNSENPNLYGKDNVDYLDSLSQIFLSFHKEPI